MNKLQEESMKPESTLYKLMRSRRFKRKLFWSILRTKMAVILYKLADWFNEY